MLEDFNALDGEAAERALLACAAAPRFAQEVAAGRPYRSVEALAGTAAAVAGSLSWAEVELALAAHPRIGERGSAESQREQAGLSTADAATRAELADGNRAYEQRFGHVFLIRAAGRSPAGMLAELRRRLGNGPEAERAETTAQLAEITRLRVERMVTG